MAVHILREKTGPNPGKGKTPDRHIAWCGLELRDMGAISAGDRMSAWTSECTCLPCLAHVVGHIEESYGHDDASQEVFRDARSERP